MNEIELDSKKKSKQNKIKTIKQRTLVLWLVKIFPFSCACVLCVRVHILPFLYLPYMCNDNSWTILSSSCHVVEWWAPHFSNSFNCLRYHIVSGSCVHFYLINSWRRMTWFEFTNTRNVASTKYNVNSNKSLKLHFHLVFSIIVLVLGSLFIS